MKWRLMQSLLHRSRGHHKQHSKTNASSDSFVSFAILSDLHLETPASRPTYAEISFENTAQCLVLLGDIGAATDERLFDFLNLQLQVFDKIFYVLGNHEPYGSDYETVKTRFLALATSSSGSFILLDQTRYDLTPTITILGCTLYSAIDSVQQATVQMFVSDFESIHRWTIQQHNAAHASDVAWLNQQVSYIRSAEPHRNVLIFTHYAPTIQPEAHSARHLTDDSGVRSAFMTDLSSEVCWTTPNVKLWAFGHTHHNCDYIDSTTGKRVVTNQKGYRRSEAVDFDAEKVIEIDP